MRTSNAFLVVLFAVLASACASENTSPSDIRTTPDAAPPAPDAELAPDAAPAATSVLSNADIEGCAVGALVSPVLPDEASHVAAGKLTPQSYPFAVGVVGYKLSVSATCTATVAHRVDVYVTTSDAIEEEPTVVATFAVDASSEDAAAPFFSNELVLDPPIVLQVGEQLVVAVEQAADPTFSRSTCLAGCLGGTSGVNFWSNASEPPYPWGDLVEDFNFNVNYLVWAKSVGSPDQG